jgi:hypothetical protein
MHSALFEFTHFFPHNIGSYGVVFKGVRNIKKLNGQPPTGAGDTCETHNKYNFGKNYKYETANPFLSGGEAQNDIDENGNVRKYAIKRIFPTINAAFILIEMLILKYLK